MPASKALFRRCAARQSPAAAPRGRAFPRIERRHAVRCSPPGAGQRGAHAVFRSCVNVYRAFVKKENQETVYENSP
ncbi:MAG: hypothetical protein DBY17_08530 [Oscillospiraceae bacterium]|nr:MAG: hypothetical protein DBY17_08530 [Oscillospiraceae bacterium]